jgi:hypothetical protein
MAGARGHGLAARGHAAELWFYNEFLPEVAHACAARGDDGLFDEHRQYVASYDG